MLLQESKNNRNGKIKSQRLINALLNAKRLRPSISIKELEAVAFGFKESQSG